MVEHVMPIRAFNRFYTERIGVLDERYLGTERPLGESRLLFEIGAEGADVAQLRARVGLDSGYLSRLLTRLAADGLVVVTPRADDRRARTVALTAPGLAALADLDDRSDRAVDDLVAGLDEGQRGELVSALDRARRLLRLAAVRVEVADPAGAPARAALRAYADELRARFPEGFDDAGLLTPAQIGTCVLAVEDGRAVGCGVVRGLGGDDGELRHLWVHGDLCGVGLARRLLAALEDAARDLGVATLRLGTHEALVEAVALYRGAGYAPVDDGGGTVHDHHRFAKRL